MSRPLSDRPNLEQLKKQAKSLLGASRAKDAAALARFAALPAFANRSPGALADAGLALHDAQSVIAREHGFPSWKALREEIEVRTLSFDAAVDAFVRYATGRAADRARRLCALGANPNAEYHWNWHPELPRTALCGALCEVRHLPLAEALLEAGANPTDGVSAHIAGGSGDVAALELLHRFGLDVDGIAGGVPPLVYTMLWTSDPAGPRWLLERGADANLAWGDSGDAPLHVAARRWDLAMVERLVEHGANPALRRADGATAHTLAELHGRHDIAT